MGDEEFSSQPDLGAVFAKGLGESTSNDDDEWGEDAPSSHKKIVVKIRDKADNVQSSGPIDASFLSALGAPSSGPPRRRGAPPATPPQAPKPNTATSPFPTPTKGPPPPLPGKKPSQNPHAVQTLESTFGAAPANGGADPFSSNGLGAMGAGTGGADPFMHHNGMADESDPFVVPPPNSAPPPPLGPPPPVADEDDGFADLASHAKNHGAAHAAVAADGATAGSGFANFASGPDPLQLALADKAELVNEVRELEMQLVMAKVTIAELSAENSKLRHALALKGVKWDS